MIKAIIELLAQEEYLGQSDRIEIAKGKHEMATTIKETLRKLKRTYYAQDSSN